MFILEQSTGKKHLVVIEEVTGEDYKKITKPQYFFNWRTEKGNRVYKLRRTNDSKILGLISLIKHEKEPWIRINLLAVSIENRGKMKQYDRIGGTLIGFACREAMRFFGKDACVSLIPKTVLKKHYINKYDMQDAGEQIFLAGLPLLKNLNDYEL